MKKKLLISLSFVLLVLIFSLKITDRVYADDKQIIEINNKVTDLLSDNDDINHYKFKVDKEGYFQFIFNGVCQNPQYGWTITLSDSKCNEIYALKQCKNSVVSPTFSFEPGEYYISIQAGWNYSNYVPIGVEYQVGINFYESTQWEHENNNSYDSAKKIHFDTDYYGTLYNNSDTDYFMFSIDDTGYINVAFEAISEFPLYGWSYYLYDSNLNQIYSSEKNLHSQLSSNFGLVKGTYYIKIAAGWNYINQVPLHDKYILKVNFNKDNTWEAEFDNPESMKILKIDQPINASLYRNEDEDYFKLPVAQKGTYSFQFDFKAMDVQYGWNLRILDDNMQELYSWKQIKNCMNTEEVTLSKGSYYVVISAGWNYYTYVPVNIIYTITPRLMEMESNDSLKKANLISVPKLTKGLYEGSICGKLSSKKDTDIYKFKVSDKMITKISFTAKAKKTWKILMFNSKFEQIDSISQIKKTVSKEYTLKKGTYYIQIMRNNGKYSSKTYTLNVNEKSK